MADIDRYEIVWNGLSGLPGVSVLYVTNGQDATANLVTFFGAIKSLFPTPLTWTIPNAGDTIDDVTGTLTGGWTGVGGGSVAATGSAAYAAGTGMFIRWGTALIVGGRRLRGRTFLCPLSGNQYESDGTIVGSSVATIQTPLNTLVATGKLVVWHRPDPFGSPTGASSTITSGTAVDQVTSLRTRRV